MIIAFLIALILGYILECFIPENRRYTRIILPMFTIIFAVIVMGGSTGDIDNGIYQVMYNRGSLEKGLGFQLLIQICKTLGMSYMQFRLLVATIGYLLINSTVRRFTFNKNIYYILYLIYPFCFDCVQIRNFLAMSIFVFSIQFLIKDEKKIKNNLIFCGLILIASSIQIVAIAYLPIVFIQYIHENKYFKLLLILAIVVSIIIGLNKNIVVHLISSYGDLILNSTTGGANYLSVNTNLGWILSWSQQFINFGLVYSARGYCKNNISVIHNIGNERKMMNLVDTVYDINMYMFLFLPLLVVDENYSRIIRNVMAINIVVYALVYHIVKNKRKSQSDGKFVINIKVLCVLTYQVCLFILMARTYTETIIIPLLFQNGLMW